MAANTVFLSFPKFLSGIFSGVRGLTIYQNLTFAWLILTFELLLGMYKASKLFLSLLIKITPTQYCNTLQDALAVAVVVSQ